MSQLEGLRQGLELANTSVPLADLWLLQAPEGRRRLGPRLRGSEAVPDLDEINRVYGQGTKRFEDMTPAEASARPLSLAVRSGAT